LVHVLSTSPIDGSGVKLSADQKRRRSGQKITGEHPISTGSRGALFGDWATVFGVVAPDGDGSASRMKKVVLSPALLGEARNATAS
jgi:hypothetical protein